MEKKYDETIIGYSGFILFDDCYEYNEDACYLAHSKDSATQFMINCGFNKLAFRIDEITIDKLVNDYGSSSGEYAMEKLAFEKFKQIADEKGIKYEYEDFDMDPELKVVNL